MKAAESEIEFQFKKEKQKKHSIKQIFIFKEICCIFHSPYSTLQRLKLTLKVIC